MKLAPLLGLGLLVSVNGQCGQNGDLPMTISGTCCEQIVETNGGECFSITLESGGTCVSLGGPNCVTPDSGGGGDGSGCPGGAPPTTDGTCCEDELDPSVCTSLELDGTPPGEPPIYCEYVGGVCQAPPPPGAGGPLSYTIDYGGTTYYGTEEKSACGEVGELLQGQYQACECISTTSADGPCSFSTNGCGEPDETPGFDTSCSNPQVFNNLEWLCVESFGFRYDTVSTECQLKCESSDGQSQCESAPNCDYVDGLCRTKCTTNQHNFECQNGGTATGVFNYDIGIYSTCSCECASGFSGDSCEYNICGADERVVSNACVACPAGKTNAEGDDASGTDTTCDASDVPPPAEQDAAESTTVDCATETDATTYQRGGCCEC